jgi:hypothetical protein
MPDALMACARLFAMPEEGRGSLSWARTVLNYPAAIRLFEHAIEDGLVVGKLAHEWREAGVKGALQNGATYYASARRALEIQERNEKYDDSRLWEEAGQAAMQELKRLHPEQFAELAKAAYEHLRQR